MVSASFGCFFLMGPKYFISSWKKPTHTTWTLTVDGDCGLGIDGVPERDAVSNPFQGDVNSLLARAPRQCDLLDVQANTSSQTPIGEKVYTSTATHFVL